MSRNTLLFSFIFSLSLLYSCNYGMEIEDLKFSVTASEEEVMAGDSIVFTFDGNAEYISLWTGEVYSDYDYRNGRQVEAGWQYQMSFNSKIIRGIQNDQIAFFASNSFDGNYSDYESLIHTDWTDITSRFDWATDSKDMYSGQCDMSEFIHSAKPLYLAFRYRTLPQADNGASKNWMISNLFISNVTDELGELPVYDIPKLGFTVVDPFSRTDAAGNCAVSGTQLSFLGPTGVLNSQDQLIYPDEASEQWVVSAPIYFEKIINLGPDSPLAVKGFMQSDIKSYSYAYAEPGDYLAVFVASNQNISHKKEVIKTIKITVK